MVGTLAHLDVPIGDAHAMAVVDGHHELLEQAPAIGFVDAGAAVRPPAVDQLAEVAAVQILQHDAHMVRRLECALSETRCVFGTAQAEPQRKPTNAVACVHCSASGRCAAGYSALGAGIACSCDALPGRRCLMQDEVYTEAAKHTYRARGERQQH